VTVGRPGASPAAVTVGRPAGHTRRASPAGAWPTRPTRHASYAPMEWFSSSLAPHGQSAPVMAIHSYAAVASLIHRPRPRPRSGSRVSHQADVRASLAPLIQQHRRAERLQRLIEYVTAAVPRSRRWPSGSSARIRRCPARVRLTARASVLDDARSHVSHRYRHARAGSRTVVASSNIRQLTDVSHCNLQEICHASTRHDPAPAA
jgi:hypothetical protein